MNYKKLLFVFNPKSGKGLVSNYLCEIVDTFVKQGYRVTVHPTQKALDAYITIRDLGDEYDLVVCSGGDGTLNESVRGMMEMQSQKLPSQRRLGYIPTGTTNDFANTLCLSKNVLTAANTAVSGKDFLIDIGSFNDTYFSYVSAFGAFTDVPYETPQTAKNVLGHVAYVLEGIRRLGSIISNHMRISYTDDEGDHFVEDDYVFGMVSNSMSVGGFKGKINLGVVLDDGLFEVALLKTPSRLWNIQKTLNSLVKRDFIGAEGVEFFRAYKVTFESDCEVAWTLDGEYGGSVKKANIRSNKQAISLLIDNPSPPTENPMLTDIYTENVLDDSQIQEDAKNQIDIVKNI